MKNGVKFSALSDLINAFMDEMLSTMEAKNKDYADADISNDPFANFRLCERMGTCSTERGMVVRMSDKLQRISNILDRDAAVDDESIADTLTDLANYALLLRAYIGLKDELP